MLEEILPVMLQFMSDEYDDTSSTIFPMLQTILNSVCRLYPLLMAVAEPILRKVQTIQKTVPCSS